MRQPAENERILAAASHLSVIFYFFGPIIPSVIWATSKESTYVRFQSAQATVFQMILVILSAAGATLYVATFSATYLTADILADEGPVGYLIPAASFSVPLAIMLLQSMTYLAFSAYGIFGAYHAYRGVDFRYPVIGDRLAGKPHYLL